MTSTQKQRVQWNGIESQETGPCVFKHLTYDRDDSTEGTAKMAFSTSRAGTNGYSLEEKNEIGPQSYTVYKNQSSVN